MLYDSLCGSALPLQHFGDVISNFQHPGAPFWHDVSIGKATTNSWCRRPVNRSRKCPCHRATRSGTHLSFSRIRYCRACQVIMATESSLSSERIRVPRACSCYCNLVGFEHLHEPPYHGRLHCYSSDRWVRSYGFWRWRSLGPFGTPELSIADSHCRAVQVPVARKQPSRLCTISS